MATPANLVTSRRLIRYELDPEDERQPIRLLYLAPLHADWIRDELPNLPYDRRGDLSPYEQVAAAFDRYVADPRLTGVGDFVNIMPQHRGVYEIKTTHVRIFGWFYRPCQFIAATGAMKAELKKSAGAVAKRRAQVEKFRDGLELEPPLFTRHGLNVRELLQS